MSLHNVSRCPYRPMSLLLGCLWLNLALLMPASAQAQGSPDLLWAAAGHSDGEPSVAFSPDGQMLATCGGDGTIKLWNVAPQPPQPGGSAGGFIRSMGGAITEFNKIAFTPDGQFLVSGSDWLPGGGDQEFKLWRVSDGAYVHDFGGEGASGTINVGPWAISPDGLTLATNYNYTNTRLWRIADGALLHTQSGCGDPIGFAQDGTMLVVRASSGAAAVWRISDWTLVRTIDVAAPNWPNVMLVSPDGQTLACGYNNTANSVRLWRIADGQSLQTLTTVPAYSVLALAFSPDGANLVAAGEEDFSFPYLHRMFVFRLSDGAILHAIGANYGATFAVACSPNGQIVSAGADDFVHLFDAATGNLLGNFGKRRGGVGSVAFSHSSAILASGNSGNETFDGADIELFTAANGQWLRNCHGHHDVINSVAFAAQDDVLASGSGSPPPDTVDPTVRLWRVADGQLLWTAPGHGGGTTSVTFAHKDQVVVSGGRDNLVRIWSRANGALITALTGHTGWVQAVALSPDGTLLASGGDTHVRIWQTSNWSFVRSLSNDGWNVNSIAFSPDGASIAITGERYGDNLRLVSVADGTLIRQFEGDPFDFMRQASFTPDGRFIVTSSRGYPPRVWMWNVADGSVAQTYEREVGWRYSPKLAVSPNGQFIGIGRADATVEVVRNPAAAIAGDITGDGVVNVNDLLAVILNWGLCPAPPALCPADIAPAPNGNGVVNVDDLLMVIVNWG